MNLVQNQILEKMNRRGFFKKTGVASIGVIIAPSVIKEVIKEAPPKEMFGVVIPKRRRSGSNLITNYDLTHPEFLKKLYKKYGNQKSYFQLLKSLYHD